MTDDPIDWPLDVFAAALNDVDAFTREAAGEKELASVVLERVRRRGEELKKYGARGPWW